MELRPPGMPTATALLRTLCTRADPFASQGCNYDQYRQLCMGADLKVGPSPVPSERSIPFPLTLASDRACLRGRLRMSIRIRRNQ